MPRENANQSIKPKAVRSAGEPDQVNDRVAKPSPFISSAGLAKALTQPPILALLWIGVFVHLWSMFETLRTRTHKWDFSLYYLGSYAQSHGINPYTANLVPLAHRLGLQPGLRAGNFDPPFMVIAMEPLTWMSVTAAYWTWFAVNVVALSVALYLLIGRYSSLDRRSASAFVALALIYPPLGTHFYCAQSQIVALLLLVLIDGTGSSVRGWRRFRAAFGPADLPPRTRRLFPHQAQLARFGVCRARAVVLPFPDDTFRRHRPMARLLPASQRFHDGRLFKRPRERRPRSYC
jgi:glycosyl transferase family 87